MAVSQTPDGRWFCYYREAGKTRREYFGRGPAARAAAMQRDQAIQSARHPLAAPAAPSFQEVCVAYQQFKRGSMPLVSQQNLFYKLQGVILESLGPLSILRIDADHLDNYVHQRLTEGRTISKPRKGGGKPFTRMIPPAKRTTVHRELSDIRAVVNWAVKRGIIDRSPMTGYEFPTRDDEIITPPSPEEIAAIVRHAAPHLTLAILIAHYCGLRPGGAELFGIKWADINWQTETLLIRAAKKGGRPSRPVPLHPALAAVLRAAQEKARAETVIEYQGRPVTSLKTAWKAAKRRAGIKRRLRLYDIRHAFVTALLEGGADLKTVAELIGDRVETMVQHYQHVTGQLRRATILQIPDLGNTVLPDQPRKP